MKYGVCRPFPGYAGPTNKIILGKPKYLVPIKQVPNCVFPSCSEHYLLEVQWTGGDTIFSSWMNRSPCIILYCTLSALVQELYFTMYCTLLYSRDSIALCTVLICTYSNALYSKVIETYPGPKTL